MKRRYQIDQQRAVQQFRRLATEHNPDDPADGRHRRLVCRKVWATCCGTRD